MYGDTTVMRRRADALREQATDLRSTADRLVAQADSTDWAGRAADALRDRIRERAAHLREVAGAHDSAADSLEAHGEEVDRLKDSIAGLERRAAALVADARTRIARLGDLAGGRTVLEPQPEDTAAVSFVPPPPGHRDWLSVELPGL